jgi:hypothetical protein
MAKIVGRTFDTSRLERKKSLKQFGNDKKVANFAKNIFL